MIRPIGPDDDRADRKARAQRAVDAVLGRVVASGRAHDDLRKGDAVILDELAAAVLHLCRYRDRADPDRDRAVIRAAALALSIAVRAEVMRGE